MTKNTDTAQYHDDLALRLYITCDEVKSDFMPLEKMIKEDPEFAKGSLLITKKNIERYDFKSLIHYYPSLAKKNDKDDCKWKHWTASRKVPRNKYIIRSWLALTKAYSPCKSGYNNARCLLDKEWVHKEFFDVEPSKEDPSSGTLKEKYLMKSTPSKEALKVVSSKVSTDSEESSSGESVASEEVTLLFEDEELKGDHEAGCQKIKDEYESIFRDLEIGYKTSTQDLIEEHDSVVKDLNTEHETLTKKLREEHEDSTKKLKFEYEQLTKNSKLEEKNSSGDSDVEHARSIKELRSEHEQVLKDLKAEQATNNLKIEHEQALKDLRAEYEKGSLVNEREQFSKDLKIKDDLLETQKKQFESILENEKLRTELIKAKGPTRK